MKQMTAFAPDLYLNVCIYNCIGGAAHSLAPLVRSDAVLIWEDAEHSPESNVQIFFGKHIPPAERDVARAVIFTQGDTERHREAQRDSERHR